MTLEGMAIFYYNQGLILFKNNDLTNALESFKKAFQFNTNDWICLNAMGLCLYRLGRFGECKAVWEKSINLNSSKDNLALTYLESISGTSFKDNCEKYNKALALLKDKNFKAAAEILKNNELRKYSVVLLENLYGLCCFGYGDKDEAIKSWRKVLEVDKNNPQATSYLLKTLEEDMDKKKGFINWLRSIFK